MYIFIPFAIYIFFMSSMSCFCEFIKAQERFQFLKWLFSIEFFLVPRLIHEFYTRGLLITCTYFFPFHYIFFITSGSSFCEFINEQERFPFLKWFPFLLVLWLGHGFYTSWLFLTCMYFFPFHYTFFSWVLRVLFANS